MEKTKAPRSRKKIEPKEIPEVEPQEIPEVEPQEIPEVELVESPEVELVESPEVEPQEIPEEVEPRAVHDDVVMSLEMAIAGVCQGKLDHAFKPGDSECGWERQCSVIASDGLRHCGYPPEAHLPSESPTPREVLESTLKDVERMVTEPQGFTLQEMIGMETPEEIDDMWGVKSLLIAQSHPRESPPVDLWWLRDEESTNIWRCRPDHPRNPELEVRYIHSFAKAYCSLCVDDGERYIFKDVLTSGSPSNESGPILEGIHISSALYRSWLQSGHPEQGGYVAPPTESCPGKIYARYPQSVICPSNLAGCSSWGKRMAGKLDEYEATAKAAVEEARIARSKMGNLEKENLRYFTEIGALERVMVDLKDSIRGKDGEIVQLKSELETALSRAKAREEANEGLLAQVGKLEEEIRESGLKRTRVRLRKRGEDLHALEKEYRKLAKGLTSSENRNLFLRMLAVFFLKQQPGEVVDIPFTFNMKAGTDLDVRKDEDDGVYHVGILTPKSNVQKFGTKLNEGQKAALLEFGRSTSRTWDIVDTPDIPFRKHLLNLVNLGYVELKKGDPEIGEGDYFKLTEAGELMLEIIRENSDVTREDSEGVSTLGLEDVTPSPQDVTPGNEDVTPSPLDDGLGF